VRCTNHEGSSCVISSFSTLLRHSRGQIFSTAPYSRTSSVHTFLSVQEAKFHTHTQKGKVYRRRGCEGPEGEQRCSCTLSLTSALDGVRWSTPLLGRFTAEEETGTHFTRCWVRPRAGLKGCWYCLPHRDSIPGPSSP